MKRHMEKLDELKVNNWMRANKGLLSGCTITKMAATIEKELDLTYVSHGLVKIYAKDLKIPGRVTKQAMMEESLVVMQNRITALETAVRVILNAQEKSNG